MSGNIYHRLDDLQARLSAVTRYLGFVDDYVHNKDFVSDIPVQYFKIQFSKIAKDISKADVHDIVNFAFSKRKVFLPTFALWHWHVKAKDTGFELVVTILVRVDKAISLNQMKSIIGGSCYCSVLDDSIFQIVNYIKYYGIGNKIELQTLEEGAEIWKVGGDDVYLCNKLMNTDVFLSSDNYNSTPGLQKYYSNLIYGKDWFRIFDIKF